ncbi:hypothetical protein BDZ45DRAFT_740957 [Acephala macrosclerotiorum]|nr:hypothetical protein BDZ45DRAFT_740957 [Acephala macrosclerotiorum]
MSTSYDTPNEANLAFNVKEVQEKKISLNTKLDTIREGAGRTPAHQITLEKLEHRLFHLGNVAPLLAAREAERTKAKLVGMKIEVTHKEEIEGDLRISSNLLVMFEAFAVELAGLKLDIKVSGRRAVRPAPSPMDTGFSIGQNNSSAGYGLQEGSTSSTAYEDYQPAKRRRVQPASQDSRKSLYASTAKLRLLPTDTFDRRALRVWPERLALRLFLLLVHGLGGLWSSRFKH